MVCRYWCEDDHGSKRIRGFVIRCEAGKYFSDDESSSEYDEEIEEEAEDKKDEEIEKQG